MTTVEEFQEPSFTGLDGLDATTPGSSAALLGAVLSGAALGYLFAPKRWSSKRKQIAAGTGALAVYLLGRVL